MSTDIEKTIPSLVRPAAKSVPIALAGAVAFCLVVGLLASVYYQAWAAAAVLFVGIAALIALVILQFGELLRFATGKRADFVWMHIAPEIQREILVSEVEQIAKHIGFDDGDNGELLSTYIVAHDLALRQIQQEHNAAMIRHAAVGRVSFDALVPGADRLTCVDVSFLVTPELQQDKIDAMLKKIAHLSKVFEADKIGLELRLVIILVTQLDADGESELRASLRQKRFASTTADIDIRIFDFEDLQRTFLTD
jgi:hypothetical protein